MSKAKKVDMGDEYKVYAEITKHPTFSGQYLVTWKFRDGATHSELMTKGLKPAVELAKKWIPQKSKQFRTTANRKLRVVGEKNASDLGVSDADRNPSMSKMGRSRPTRKPTDADIERRDREAGMAMDAMTVAKRKKERELFGEDRASDYGVSDADRNPSMARDAGKSQRPAAKPKPKKYSSNDPDAFDRRKRDRERAMFGEAAATEKDIDETKPIIIKGVKGMKSKPFTKKFRNMAAYDKWSDTDAAGDFEVHQVMNESRRLNEGVLDDMDDDGFMAKRQLYDLAKYSVELHRMIQDTDNLEPWVQAKITKAADYIDTVKHYLEYQGVRDADDMADEIGMDDIADVETSLDTMAPEAPVEAVAEDWDDFDSWVQPEDVLRWAQMRGVISKSQYDDPEPVLYQLAGEMADSIGGPEEVGSSDVSIWMREFVRMAEAENVLLMGPKVDAYYELTEAQKRYQKMIAPLKGKK